MHIQKAKKAISKEADVLLKSLYSDNRSEFISWAARRFSTDLDELTDVYQDAVITFYVKLKRGDLDKVDATAAAYVFGIARNLLLKKTEKEKRIHRVAESTDFDFLVEDKNEDLYTKMETNHQKQKINSALDKLGEKCQEIIRLFYYNRYTIESIQYAMGYNSTDVVRSQKLKCMKQLRRFF